jgi:hypothetical protein
MPVLWNLKLKIMELISGRIKRQVDNNVLVRPNYVPLVYEYMIGYNYEIRSHSDMIEPFSEYIRIYDKVPPIDITNQTMRGIMEFHREPGLVDDGSVWCIYRNMIFKNFVQDQSYWNCMYYFDPEKRCAFFSPRGLVMKSVMGKYLSNILFKYHMSVNDVVITNDFITMSPIQYNNYGADNAIETLKLDYNSNEDIPF